MKLLFENYSAVAYERLIMTYNPEHRYLYRDKDGSGVAEETDLFRMIARRDYDHTEVMSIESWKGLARSTS